MAVKVTKIRRRSGKSNVEIYIPHMGYAGGYRHPEKGN